MKKVKPRKSNLLQYHQLLITGRLWFSHGRSGCYGRDIGADGCLSRRPRVTPPKHELDVPGLSCRAPPHYLLALVAVDAGGEGGEVAFGERVGGVGE